MNVTLSQSEEEHVLLVDGLQGLTLPEFERAANKLLETLRKLGATTLAIRTPYDERERMLVVDFDNKTARSMLWQRLQY